jgi:tetratricopeptide (TPR) repeat protein
VTDAARWRRLSAALDQLLDLDAARRGPELEHLAEGDAAFAAELRELLHSATRTDGVLEEGVAVLAPETLAALAAPPEDPGLIGRRIGHWRILRRLGRGGMGEVLLAERDDAGFVQQAALKRLKRGMDSDELLRRFAQERRILASLEHPLIARLLDGGVDAEGRPYFAMEYVDGAPITAYAAAHALGVRERVALVQRVCEAVAYAQERLVVHRDLKPSNVLVDARGEPRLLDFGIAKLLGTDPDQTQTQAGVRIMSPAYAAPEQITGGTVSTATDVYALGVLLFELLAGSLPHARRGTAADALIGAATQEVADPPSRVLRRADREQAERAYGARAGERQRFARQLEGDLDRIVLAALRREPERRYPSAAALANELRLFLEGRPIAARADSTGYRLRKFVQRNKAGVSAAALALVALLAGLGVALWQADVARRHAVEAEWQREQAVQVKDFVVQLLREATPSRSRHGAEMKVVELLRVAEELIKLDLEGNPLAQGEMRFRVGDALASMGEPVDGLAMVEAGVGQLKEIDPPPVEELARGLSVLSTHFQRRGRLDEAERAASEGLKLLENPGEADTSARFVLRNNLAMVASRRGDYEAAAQAQRAILEELQTTAKYGDIRLPIAWAQIGNTALRASRYQDAERAYAEAGRQHALNPNGPEAQRANIQYGLGFAHGLLGDYATATRELEAARVLAERALHPRHVQVAAVLSARSRLARYEGRIEEAIADASQARDIFAQHQHPDLGQASLELGLALLAARRAIEAEPALVESIGLFEASQSREPGWQLARAALGLARLERGDVDGIDAIQAALAAMQGAGQERSNAYAEALALRARAAAHVGDASDAQAWRQREQTALTALLGAAHPRVRAATAACTPAAADCPPARP